MKELILASASPRRSELLAQLGYAFSVHAVDIDETPTPNEPPFDYLRRMSMSKAEEAARQIGASQQEKNLLILTADTSVISAQRIMGKPENESHFYNMMSELSGSWHEVLTSIAIVELERSNVLSPIEERTVVTRVKFKDISQQEMAAYWHTKEPCDKAGGYGIQGKGALFVEKIEGSYTNVVGLPLCECARMLSEKGLSAYELWDSVS